MANLRELFEEVRKGFEHRPALSVTKLPQNSFFRILGMEKRATIYGDRILVELDHTHDVWLTEFWSKNLDGEAAKRLTKEGKWRMAYMGLKRTGQYSHADISIQEDLEEYETDATMSITQKAISAPPTALAGTVPLGAAVATFHPLPGPSQQDEDVIVLENSPPPPKNTSSTNRKRGKRGIQIMDQSPIPPPKKKIQTHPIGPKLAQSPIEHTFESLFAEDFE